jgi:hypothetical protein
MNFRYGATALFYVSEHGPGDQLHVLLNNGALASYKVAIGEQVYHRQIGGGSFSASPAVDEGKIYCSIPKRENSTAIKSR